MSASDPLATLRDAIAGVDRGLLELLRRRMELAGQIGRVKAASGAPIVVHDVEDRVLGRAREQAASCGVSEAVLEEVFRAVIRASVERQHRVGVALREQRGERLLIAGGAGGMGGWFRAFFALAGHTVDVADPALAGLPSQPGCFASLDEVADLDAYAAVLVAVPLARMPEVLDQLVARSPRALLVEIASIKDALAPALAQASRAGVRVLSLHPMFGPGKSQYEPLTFVLATRRDPRIERAEVEPFLSHPYTEVVAIPFARHDRLMGWLLGLAHLTSMLFGAALLRSGIDAAELHACASTTFLRQAATARSVLGEDSDLYLDIQRLNPFRSEVYSAAQEALTELVRLVEANDRGAFRDMLGAARQTLGAKAEDP
jgi:chorismate mutase/prephenate dehydrogenase